MTVETFGTPKRYASPKTMTVTRMVTATRLIFLTVDKLLTLFTRKKDMRAKNDDKYADGDRDPPDPSNC